VKQKLLFIGLDGGTFDVLNPFIRDGDMPNLARLIENGVSGKLESTIPFLTAPAWSSFFTGKNPGAHGLYDFFTQANSTQRKQQFVHFGYIKSKTIWSMLTKAGKKIGSINVPVTYPIPNIDGYLICGLMAPPDRITTYPENLAEELGNQFDKHDLDISWSRYTKRDIDSFMSKIISSNQQKREVTLHLMKKFDWDFFITVFTETDRLQHLLWNYIHNADNKDKDSLKTHKAITQYYRELDKAIGEIITFAGNNTKVIIMSDHGFGPTEKKVYINSWLEEQGLLSFYKDKTLSFNNQRRKRFILYQILKRFDILNIVSKLSSKIKRTPRILWNYNKVLDCIDWQKTKAYVASNTNQGIYINLKGREPNGIVEPGKEYESVREAIIKSLQSFLHPVTKEPLVSHIWKREDIYKGEYVDNAPDILFILREGAYLVGIQPSKDIFEDVKWESGSGSHRRDGMFIAHGEDILQGKECKDAKIIDLAPTILHILGIPVPKDIEGRVLDEIYTENYKKNNPVKYSDESSASEGKENLHAGKDEDKTIEDILKGLGYI